MDGLSVAANIVAVVELSVKVASLCAQYCSSVKNAKEDITRLQGVVENLNDVFKDCHNLLDGPHGPKLESSQKLRNALKESSSYLNNLASKLELGRGRKTMNRLGIRALRWPFTSIEVDRIISGLKQSKENVALAMQIDQTRLVLEIDRKIDFATLRTVEGATFDSHIDEHDARCHPDTRTDLRNKIEDWARNPNGECIFWLNGKAGTGKSTISRTIAQTFANNEELGASFFFKRGEGDRGKAARFFTTIASQLAYKIPEIMPAVGKAIEAHPNISEKQMKEQFEKLILEPMLATQRDTTKILTRVIVIDALDECERDNDIKTILHLLSRMQEIRSVRLRVFVTSRPELPIRLGFGNMSDDAHQDLVLHEIPKQIIDDDLFTFLKDELARIRNENSLPLGWPGDRTIHVLVEMATPLFIFAATACRFLQDRRLGGDPNKQLQALLKYQNSDQASQLDKTYLPVLERLETGLNDRQKQRLAERFRLIVGSIVLLEEPLTTTTLARLLSISRDDIDSLLDYLHSVLDVPHHPGHPVRLLHLSFRDFLLDPAKHGKTPFSVDEIKTHEIIAIKCLELMDSREGLRRDPCNLESPGVIRSQIENQRIDECLAPELQYACRYWVEHLEQSKNALYYQDRVHTFLRKHLLHWLESMSLMGRMTEAVGMITSLRSTSDKWNSCREFIHDAARFALINRSIIEQAPLQTYVSALIFAPRKSIIRNQFEKLIPSWLQRLPEAEEAWSAVLQTLEGHSNSVNAVAFSLDGSMVASASSDQTVKLWDARSGEERQTLKGHGDSVNAVVFSPDGSMVASASGDQTIKLWDVRLGEERQTLKGHGDWINAVAFSPDGSMVASASWDQTVKLWDAYSGEEQQTLKGHGNRVNTVAFSPDGSMVASASWDQTIKLWDAYSGEERQTLKGHNDWVNAVAFSPDGSMIASASWDQTVKLWEAHSGEEQQTLKGHGNWVNAVAFSPDGSMVASASSDETVKLWEARSGEEQQTLKGHSDPVNAVVFSPDGSMVASASVDKTVKLWEARSGEEWQTFKGHGGSVNAVAFSPTGLMVASVSSDRTVKLWDAHSGEEQQTLKGHAGLINAVAFSPDGSMVASASSDQTVKLWEAHSGEERQTFKGHSNYVSAVAFSPDGSIVASASWDETVKLWDTHSGEEQQTLKGHGNWVNVVAFSPDGSTVVSASVDKTVKLWDTHSGEEQQTLKGHGEPVNAVAFSPDGSMIASASWDQTVKLWDALSGEERQTQATYCVIKNISFSTTGPFLQTDRGLLRVSHYSPDAASPVITGANEIFVSENWVTRNSEKLLWLPPEYRPTCSTSASNILVLGLSSGRVTFIEFG